MRFLKTFFSLILFAITFSGCLQVDTTVYVNKDGSGTINETVLFSEDFINIVKEFTSTFQDSTFTGEFNIFQEDDIIADAKDYGDDVVYVSYEKIKKDGWEGYKAIYSFDDVTKIKIAPDPDSKVDLEEEAVSNEMHEEHYFFKFVKGDTPQLIIDRPDLDLDVELNDSEDFNDHEHDEEESEHQDDEQIIKMMQGMKIFIAVEVEGEIVNTNATYVDGSKVTLFSMDFSEMMKNKEVFKEFKKNEPENIDELKYYLGKLPGIQIEVEKPISINFK